MKISQLVLALVLGLSAAQVGPVYAQDDSNLSAEEIAERFKNQKTRGLVIAPGTDTGTGGEVAEGAAPAVPGTVVEVAKADQVNIQIRFDFDSARLNDSEKPKLVALCSAMKSVDVQVFRIVGHTDSSGSAAYNEKLSLLRAEEVKRHLVSECGIEPTRLEAVGVGEAMPFDENDPRADANRRVEFQVVS
ncbi:OmpA family protein [Frigidibacter sp. ROC022]|uniref:OmpA family protein n=1 Tax=Frigidibacter sp. ROC022 TaxID=2971796 RepID=UPI00215A923F|nr:OmpA family protein [Frigidibacter sp. ROC022]MCR8723344.1 OmpA family protein [Frigidibacter sp. ROC022]